MSRLDKHGWRGGRSLALTLLGTLALVPPSARAEPLTFRLDPAGSAVTVHVGKAGLFRFAGHEHEVTAPIASGEVVADPADPGSSEVHLAFDAASLRVTGSDEPAEDVPKVQEAMVGPQVLEAARFPRIEFASRVISAKEASPGRWDLRIEGELRIHDMARKLVLPVRVELRGDDLVAEGHITLKQSDYGIRPISVGGVVKVKDELAVDYRFVGHRSVN
jgi:polyisoprenoid-binding protein YceI